MSINERKVFVHYPIDDEVLVRIPANTQFSLDGLRSVIAFKRAWAEWDQGDKTGQADMLRLTARVSMLGKNLEDVVKGAKILPVSAIQTEKQILPETTYPRFEDWVNGRLGYLSVDDIDFDGQILNK